VLFPSIWQIRNLPATLHFWETKWSAATCGPSTSKRFKTLPGAVLLFDRFHVVAHLNRAVEQQRLSALCRKNQPIVRAYYLKEAFQCFWEYRSDGWAARY
jgi:hypothetical protein